MIMNSKRILTGIIAALCLTSAGLGKDPVVVAGGGDKPKAPVPASPANDPALVAWWQLDETSGTDATDESPGKQNGKLVGGPAWTKGKKGGALKLDGKDDYVAITKAYFKRKDIAAVTVAAWIRTSSASNQVVASFDRDQYWQLEVNGSFAKNGQVGWSVMTDAGPINLGSRTRVTDGQWHHVAGVFDNGLATLYVDGVVDATKTTGRTCGTNNRRFGFLGVGSKAEDYDGLKAAGTFFAGDMDDVRIYSRALTSSEITALSFFGPANDDCQNAQPIGEVTNLAFDTTQASFDGQGFYIHSPNIWYLYTPSVTGRATVSLAGSRYDTMVAVYRGAEINPGPDRLVAFNDDYIGLTSQVAFDASAGQPYLIEVGGYDLWTGAGVLTVTIEASARATFDLGDAPDSTNNYGKRMTAYTILGLPAIPGNFPTVYEAAAGKPRGPLHQDPLAVAHLGPAVTLELEADKGIDEDGITNLNTSLDQADKDGADDGVVLPLQLPHGELASFEYIVSVIKPNQDLWVNVWFDWNRDGDWDDDATTDPELVAGGREVPEWAVQNQYLYGLPIGTHTLVTPGFLAWHPDKGPEKVWMRITLSEQPWKGGANPGVLGNGGSGPADGYETGETEDYLIVPEATCALCRDLNNDGKLDFDDLITMLYTWLDNCQN
jgi:hypothetical protein